jgi:hypothetical protein
MILPQQRNQMIAMGTRNADSGGVFVTASTLRGRHVRAPCSFCQSLSLFHKSIISYDELLHVVLQVMSPGSDQLLPQ